MNSQSFKMTDQEIKDNEKSQREKEMSKEQQINNEKARTNEEGQLQKEIEAGKDETLKSPKEELTIDEALDATGSFGRFQIVMQVLFTYLIVAMAYQFFMSYFIADEPSWKCTTNNNLTTNSLFCRENQGIEFPKEHVNFSRRCQLQRHEWTYTTSTKYSYTTEFDLICEKTSVSAFASGIYHLGGALGVFISGAAADRFGRKISLLVCLVMMVSFSIGCSFVTNVTQLTFIRLILGAAGWSCYSIVYVYSGEFVTPAWRPLSANVLGVGFSISMLFMDLFAYYVREWRKLQLFMALPVIVAVLSLFALPDSPRWHLVMDKRDKAEDTLNAIGRFNRQKKPCINLKEHKATSSASSNNNTYLDLLRNRKVFLMTLVLGLLWLTAGVSFYMITFESSNLGGDMYSSFAYSTVAALPSNFLATYALNRFGRKRFILICLVIAGALTGSTTVIPSSFADIYTARIVLLSLANFFVFSALLGCYIWTFEIFPTTLRLQGWGICIALERLGSFSAPFLTTVLQQYNSRLPYICVMILCILSATAGLTLPDTNKIGTRESFDDFFETRPRSDTTASAKNTDVRHDYENRGMTEDTV